MAPYHMDIEVPEYAVRMPDSYSSRVMATRGVTTMEELRRKLGDRDDFFVEDGVLYRRSTSNPVGHWDYYTVGDSRYTTLVADAATAALGRERGWDAEVCASITRPGLIPPDLTPSVIITPDGQWHDSFDCGWTYQLSEEEQIAARNRWQAVALPLLTAHSLHLGVVLDVHS